MLLLLLLLFLASGAAFAAPPRNVSCKGLANTLGRGDGTRTLLANVSHGELYSVLIEANAPPLLYATVWGTAYERGYAQGQMMKTEIANTLLSLKEIVEAQLVKWADQLPPALRKLFEEFGSEAVTIALSLEIIATEPFVGKYYLDEIRGMADASGIAYSDILRGAMFPELVKASCSMVGAWGSATTSGGLVQLRALDWDTTTIMQNYPLLLVQQPSEANTNFFATLGWPGFVGAITGISNAGVGVCEKVWLGYDGETTRFGVPFNFLMRDILQFDQSKAQAIQRAMSANRTCAIFLGIGSKTEKFDALAYSYPSVDVWNATSQPVYTGHPLIKDVVYVNKHVQPSTRPCLATLIQSNYGQITPQIMLSNITAGHETGNMHIAVYDYDAGKIYVAVAGPSDGNVTGVPAYVRPYLDFDFDELFRKRN